VQALEQQLEDLKSAKAETGLRAHIDSAGACAAGAKEKKTPEEEAKIKKEQEETKAKLKKLVEVEAQLKKAQA